MGNPFKHRALLFLGLVFLTTNACKNQQPQAEPTLETTQTISKAYIVVTQEGIITVFGKEVDLETLKNVLQDSLVKMATIPNEVPIEYKGEVLMGMRGEVETETDVALRAAKSTRHKPVLDALQISVEKALTQPVTFDVSDVRTSGSFAFVAGTMLQKDGQPMDFSKTPFKKQAEAGVFSESIFALLKNENGAWKIITQSLGATDLPIVCWWKEFSVPKDLFSESMIAEECP